MVARPLLRQAACFGIKIRMAPRYHEFNYRLQARPGFAWLFFLCRWPGAAALSVTLRGCEKFVAEALARE